MVDPQEPERMCVGMGDADQMAAMARRIRRSPLLGIGVALTDRDHPFSMESDGDFWHLYAWVDRKITVPPR